MSRVFRGANARPNDVADNAQHVANMLQRYPQIGRITRRGRPAFYTYMRSVYHESRDVDILVKLLEGKQ